MLDYSSGRGEEYELVNDNVPIDTNLQLALALSASLRCAEESEVMQEAEALKEAGLNDEADRKLSTLEKFGFASDVPFVSHNVKGTSKARSIVPTLLLKRTKEDRERIITEKVAIVLISEEESIGLEPFIDKRCRVNSKKLLKLWIQESLLWEKAHCPSEEQRNAFYVHTLSKFIEPSTAEVGEGLKGLSQLPGRLNTPKKENISDFNSPILLQDISRPEGFSSASTVHRYSETPKKTTTLSDDWKKIVGNSYLSDIIIQCNQGETIPAHKLVLYVRCPELFHVAKTQDSGTDIIVLDDCTKDSVLAFLEFVYSGTSRKMLFLSSEEIQSIIRLSKKYNYTELENELSLVDNARINQEKKLVIKSISKELFRNCSDTHDENNPKLKINSFGVDLSKENDYPSSDSKSILGINSEKYDCNKLDSSSSLSGRSPDMFGDSNVIDNKLYSTEKDDLAILASLVNKTCSQSENNDRDENLAFPLDDIDCTNSLSLSGSASVKRKAFNSSLSEDDDVTQCKRVCTDLSQSKISKNTTDCEVILDLTQSSSSSKGGSPILNQPCLDGNSDNCKAAISADNVDDSLVELTQQNPSSQIHAIEESMSQSRDLADSLNNDCPAWDGFDDDCWYYNYEYNTPQKNSTLQKYSVSSETKSGNKHSKITALLQDISSASKSPNNHSNVASPSSSVVSIRDISPAKDRFSESCFQKAVDKPLVNNEDKINTKDSLLHTMNGTGYNFSKKDLKHFNPCDNKIDIECLEKESSSKLVIGNREELSADKETSISPDIEDNKLLKKFDKKSSLAEMQGLLDDSFVIDETKFASIDALSYKAVRTSTGKDKDNDVCTSSSLSKNKYDKESGHLLMTPSPKIYVSDNVTPLPNYSSMKTPALKKELRRFGLKPSLGKGKAKLLLRHIYEQTHPFVAEPVEIENMCTEPKGQPNSMAQITQNNCTTVDLSDSETEESCSKKSTCSSLSSTATLPEESLLESEEELLTQAPTSDGGIRTSIRNLILNDVGLHRKILMYEPIFVEDLKAMLKEKGIKCRLDQIIEYLDEQCITFRTNSWKARNAKNKKRKSPKKKARVKNSGGPSGSGNLSPKICVSRSKKKPSKVKK